MYVQTPSGRDYKLIRKILILQEVTSEITDDIICCHYHFDHPLYRYSNCIPKMTCLFLFHLYRLQVKGQADGEQTQEGRGRWEEGRSKEAEDWHDLWPVREQRLRKPTQQEDCPLFMLLFFLIIFIILLILLFLLLRAQLWERAKDSEQWRETKCCLQKGGGWEAPDAGHQNERFIFSHWSPVPMGGPSSSRGQQERCG